MLKYCLLAFLLLLSHSPLSAQKVLQLETYGKLKKTRKYYIGDEVTYQLKGDDLWYTSVIERILEKEDIIVFKDRFIQLDQIRAIQSLHRRERARHFATTLNVFGVAWSVFALGGSIAVDDFSYRKGDAITSATALGLGQLIKWIFQSKKYRIGRKYRLRALDLDITKYP